ncbi:MAG: hypothetical protein Udaeo2_23290 [Candidatus Udaeobacter sp.]|nr:MAG: hypothetical protein Udaeo2_23290 [Candidatus Udaeobacter sp.]
MKASRFAIGSFAGAAGADCWGTSKASIKRLVKTNERMRVMFILVVAETQT